MRIKLRLCKRGHERTPENVTGWGACRTCRSAYDKAQYARRSERLKANVRRWVEKNPERVKAYKQRWKQANPEKVRRYNLQGGWAHRGIKFTFEQRQALLAKQLGRCAICKRHETEFKNRLALDHNHKTGKVRGLLCATCNNKVVWAVENVVELIPIAQAYLENTK